MKYKSIEAVQKEIATLERLLEVKLQVQDDVFVGRTLFPDVEDLQEKLSQLRSLHRELVLEKERIERQRRINSLLEDSLDFSILDKYKQFGKKRRVVRTDSTGTTMSVNDSAVISNTRGEPPGFVIRFRLSTAYQAIMRQQREARRPPADIKPTVLPQKHDAPAVEVYFDRMERRWKIKPIPAKKEAKPIPNVNDTAEILPSDSKKYIFRKRDAKSKSPRPAREYKHDRARTPGMSPSDGPRERRCSSVSLTRSSARNPPLTPVRRARSASCSGKTRTSNAASSGTGRRTRTSSADKVAWEDTQSGNSGVVKEPDEEDYNSKEPWSDAQIDEASGKAAAEPLQSETDGVERDPTTSRVHTPASVASQEGSLQSFSMTSIYSLDSILDPSTSCSLHSGRSESEDDLPLSSLLDHDFDASSDTSELPAKKIHLPSMRDEAEDTKRRKRQPADHKNIKKAAPENTNESSTSDQKDSESKEDVDLVEESIPGCRYIYKLSNCKGAAPPSVLRRIRGVEEIVGTIDVFDEHESACAGKEQINCPFCVVAPRRRINRWLDSLETGRTVGIYGGRRTKTGPKRKQQKKKETWINPLEPIEED